MTTKKIIRIKKDYFRKGYYSVHECGYQDSKPTSEILIGWSKNKKDAEAIKRNYLKYEQ